MSEFILDDKNTIVELEGLKFHIRPELFTDIGKALKWAKSEGYGFEHKDDNIGAFNIAAYTILTRLVKWEGIKTPKGKNAPCTEENKMRLFGKRLDLLTDLIEKLGDDKAELEKNSPTSQGG